MKKMTIKWHEECLKNMKLFCKGKLQTIAFEQAALKRVENEIVKLETQIKLAKEKGMEDFDPDRFNVKKK
jgi:hypothetical protein